MRLEHWTDDDRPVASKCSAKNEVQTKVVGIRVEHTLEFQLEHPTKFPIMIVE